jgi:hypothetical protein
LRYWVLGIGFWVLAWSLGNKIDEHSRFELLAVRLRLRTRRSS